MTIVVSRMISSALAVLLLGLCSLQASERRRGAFALVQLMGELEVSQSGGAQERITALQQPRYFSGLMRVQLTEGSQAVWAASNGLAVFQQGAFLEVERFEQTDDFGSDLWTRAKDSGQSRVIMSLRTGQAAFDSRALSEASRFSLELPFGQISDQRGLWSVTIEKHENQEYYRFAIQCRSGAIRFSDQRGQTYMLWAGQVLIGVGSPDNPAVNISAIAVRDLRKFDRISDLLIQAETVPLAADRALALMPLLSSASEIEHKRELRAVAQLGRGERSVIFVEYSVSPEPTVPFRGVRKPFFRQPEVEDDVFQFGDDVNY
jgi:hypothetical protein